MSTCSFPLQCGPGTVRITVTDNDIVCKTTISGANAYGIVIYERAIWYDGTENGPEGCHIGTAVIPGTIGGHPQSVELNGDGVLGILGRPMSRADRSPVGIWDNRVHSAAYRLHSSASAIAIPPESQRGARSDGRTPHMDEKPFGTPAVRHEVKTTFSTHPDHAKPTDFGSCETNGC